jgi:hypothetical protein
VQALLGHSSSEITRSVYLHSLPAGAREAVEKVEGLLIWISSGAHFFLPVKVLSRVFRGKFIAGMRRAFRNHQLMFYGECRSLAEEKNLINFLRTLFQQDWIVYAKPPFGGPEHVLHYLARYTHRVAISNHRLLFVSDSEVSFRWKDYAHRSKPCVMTLSCEEFLRRFVQHVLPKGFPRIRYLAGWLIARAEICSRSAVSCSTSRQQQATYHPRISPPPGSVPSAKAPCTLSNDSPLPRSSCWKPESRALMTLPDRLLKSATVACLLPCSPQLCPELKTKLLCRFNHRRETASHTWLMHIFSGPALHLPHSLSNSLASTAIKNP